MILLIDNYDSFTWNIYQYVTELGATVEVVRNDAITVSQIEALAPDKIILSPGPCTPKEAGVSVAVLQSIAARVPTLGVCLGHQCVGEAFGGRVVRAPELVHGKTSLIYHTNDGVFAGIVSPFEAIRYHSLIVERESLPDCLIVTATTANGLIMGLRHRTLPIEGVQFHPESIMTKPGKALLRNFLERPATRVGEEAR